MQPHLLLSVERAWQMVLLNEEQADKRCSGRDSNRNKHDVHSVGVRLNRRSALVALQLADIVDIAANRINSLVRVFASEELGKVLLE